MRLPRFLRRRSDGELDAEIRAYMNELIEEKIRAGLSFEEARRQARIEAGGIEQVKEEVRAARAGAWFDALLRDAYCALRMQKRGPGYTAAILVTFALGIGANTALFSVVNGLLLQRLPYRDPDRLFYVSESWPREPMVTGALSPDFAHWRNEGRLFAALEAYGEGATPTLTGVGEPERLQGAMVTRGFFDLLGVKFALGRTFTAEEDRYHGPPVAILSYALWRRKFSSDPKIVGKAATLDGHNAVIVGVLPETFIFPDNGFRTEILLPMALPASPTWYDQRLRLLHVLARLKPGTTAGALRNELFTITQNHAGEESPQFIIMRKNMEMQVAPLRQRLAGDVRPLILILQGAVALVLLIGCFNVANLQLARSVSRWREMALRSALGAGRTRLMRQLLTESLVLSLAGGGLGLLLGYAALRYLKLALPANLQLLPAVQIDYAVLAATTAAAILVGILTAIAPVTAASKIDLTAALQEDSGRATGSSGHQRLRGAFVTAEIAMAIVLLAASGLLIRSFVRLASSDLGFEPHGVLTMRISLPFAFDDPTESQRQRQTSFLAQLLERARRLPGVDAAAIGDVLPGSAVFRSSVSVNIEGETAQPPGGRPTVPDTSVSEGYFQALGIPVLRGRPITTQDRHGAPRVVVVNQAFADRFFQGRDAVGKYILLGSDTRAEVVGVAGNVRDQLRLTPQPRIYLSFRQLHDSENMLILKSSAPRALIPAATNAVHSIAPSIPVDDVATMDERIAESLSSDRTNMLLMGIFAALGLIQAAIGIFSVIAYVVSRRTHEIAIRMALGARPREAFGLVLRQGMVLTGAGIGIGLFGALLATRALRKLLYGVTPGDPVTLALAVTALGIVALAACYLPARRAARLDPAIALRHD
jgi:putative ABC transport system permease protein